MLDFNGRRFCLLMGEALEESAPETRAPSRTIPESDESHRLVHLSELMERSRLSAKELKRLVKEGQLEPPRRLHYRGFVWRSDYISAWLEVRRHLL